MIFDNRFTEKAQSALTLSHKTACELGHNYIGSEHLLLGLIKEKGSLASKILLNSGADEEKVLQVVEELLGTDSPLNPNSQIAFTPRSKRIIELSLAEARRLGHSYIGTEHILLAILREGENVAIQILNRLGINIQTLYADIVNSITSFSPNQSSSQKSVNNKSADTPTLNQFGRDLTQMAKEGKFDPVIGRDKEIQRVEQILSRRTKNNPCLIGEPGVGKTAVAEGLAQKLALGDVSESLKDKRLFALDLSSMVAGAKYRGEFEERLKKAIDEVVKAGNVVLFIDEIHTLIGAGAAEGAIDAANILKPLLARGELQIIGATTLEEYRKHVEKDAALERRFQPVTVGEPTVDETYQILLGIRDKYEAHHSAKITDEALKAAASLSARYITDRFLPDKAIDLIDEAASRKRLQAYTEPDGLKELEQELEKITKEKEAAVTVQDFEKAAALRDDENKIKEKLEKAQGEWKSTHHQGEIVVDEDAIADIISSWTNIPVKQLAKEESERLRNLETELHKRVVGQNEAVEAVSKAIRRGRVGLKDPKRPIGSFLFLGPTGVGKTELSKALAEAMFGDENALIRVDMSEYMEKHSVSKFIGSPPGYVGYDEGGQLTEKIRRKPYSVILFDEVEKAHPDVFNAMLQILDDGILTDAQGRKVDFKNTVIIMTSNLGAKNMMQSNSKLGFANVEEDKKDEDYQFIKEQAMQEVKKHFRPEFLNRIDDIIVFSRLSKTDIKNIAEIMLNNLSKRMLNNEISITFTDAAVERIAEEGFDEMYGARPLRRAIQSKIEDMLAENMLDGKIKKNDNATVDYKNDEFCVEVK